MEACDDEDGELDEVAAQVGARVSDGIAFDADGDGGDEGYRSCFSGSSLGANAPGNIGRGLEDEDLGFEDGYL